MISTTFLSGLSGWTTSNTTEVYAPADGNPDGSIRGIEAGSGIWYFVAPAEYLGDREDYYGGSLTFDLRQDVATNQFDESDVLLTGAGKTLVLDFPDNPGTGWTTYSVNLSLGAGWKVGSTGGPIASEAVIREVLADLQSLKIRGEFVVGTTGDAANLDNVSMVKTPVEPSEFIGTKITEGFDTDHAGWSFVADVKEFDWVETGGNPGGYLEAVDYATGETWYFVAPTKFTGDKSAFSGGVLQFDLKQSETGSQFDREDVAISGGGLTIMLDTASNPGTDWTHYSVNLDTLSDWRIGSLSGEVATQAQIDTVLGDITALHIRGEFVVGVDTGGLDNVVMQAKGAPVRVFADATNGGLLSNHALLEDALAVADPGNLVRVTNVSAVTNADYDVSDNGLTIQSNKPLDATLALNGVRSIALSGDNDLNVDGNGKNNRITGSDGDNTLRGFVGDDVLNGGAGRDVLIGDAGRDELSGGSGRDILRGNIGRDTLAGNIGRDKLFGGNGNDKLKGGANNDLLSGDRGNDTLTGGAGSDTFRFKDGFGADVIKDFDALDDAEKIDLSGVSSITDFTDLIDNHISPSGGDLVINALGGDTITLVGVSITDLHETDFLFAIL